MHGNSERKNYLVKCRECSIIFSVSKNDAKLRKYCSQRCSNTVNGRIYGWMGSPARQLKHPNLSRDTMIKTHKKYPKLASEAGKKGSKILHELYPNLARNTMIEMHKKNPRMASEIMIRNNEKYPNMASEAGKKGGLIGGPKAIKTLRDRSNFEYMGVKLRSNDEIIVAKLILTKPIDGVNCNVRVGNHEIDFMPQEGDKMFYGKAVEYHPIDKNGFECGFTHNGRRLTDKEYYNSRRKILDNNGYKNKELIMITSLKHLNELAQK
jgi:hypothetical protein